MIRPCLVLLIGAGLACATPSRPQNQAAVRDPVERSPQQQIADALAKGQDPAKIRICEYEEVLGTRIRQVACRNLEQDEQERATVQREMMQIRYNQMTKGDGKPGGG